MAIMSDLRAGQRRGGVVARRPETLPEDAGQPVAAAPVVPAAMPPAPSGVLPGEEQVTTQDTFRQLAPEEQAALRQKYEGGGHSSTMSYDDWLSENFGELPPQDRAATMRASAKSTPRMQIGRDPSLPPETNSPLAQNRQAAGKPLPEGRAARQYTPEQRATMQQNAESPEVPMGQFGGSFSMSADGSQARRAPNPTLVAEADKIAADQGPGSPSHVVALAQAYGIDATQYGDDMDLLRADVMREKAKHDKLGQYLGVRDNGMGGFVYVEDAAQRQRGRDQFDATLTPQQLNNQAISMRRAYAGVITPEEEAALSAAVRTPGGMAHIRDLRMELQARQKQQSWKNHLDRVAGQALGRDMANPERARGFMIRSLAEAVRSGDPMAQAAAYSMMGQPMLAMRAIDAGMSDRRSAAELAGIQAQMAGQAGNDPQTLAAQMNKEIESALALGKPSQQAQQLTLIFQKAGYPPEQIPQAVNDVLVERFATTDPNHPAVATVMRAKLKEGRGAWLQWAQSVMGLTEDQANAVYDKEVGTPQDAGRRSAENAQRNVAGWLGWAQGVVQGLTGGGVPPQAYGTGK
jgi:hypothetical protein